MSMLPFQKLTSVDLSYQMTDIPEAGLAALKFSNVPSTESKNDQCRVGGSEDHIQ